MVSFCCKHTLDDSWVMHFAPIKTCQKIQWVLINKQSLASFDREAGSVFSDFCIKIQNSNPFTVGTSIFKKDCVSEHAKTEGTSDTYKLVLYPWLSVHLYVRPSIHQQFHVRSESFEAVKGNLNFSTEILTILRHSFQLVWSKVKITLSHFVLC